MTLKKKLRITGPQASTYQLGQPMSVYAGNLLIVTLDPVRVGNDGTEVHFEEFAPEQVVFEEERPLGRLVLFEIFAFIAEHFPQVQAISFSLSRPIKGIFGSAQQVASRVEVLQSSGITYLRVEPRSSGEHVISGIWTYSDQNLAALRAALEEQREVFRERPIGAVGRKRPGLLARLHRLMPGRNPESS